MPAIVRTHGPFRCCDALRTEMKTGEDRSPGATSTPALRSKGSPEPVPRLPCGPCRVRHVVPGLLPGPGASNRPRQHRWRSSAMAGCATGSTCPKRPSEGQASSLPSGWATSHASMGLGPGGDTPALSGHLIGWEDATRRRPVALLAPPGPSAHVCGPGFTASESLGRPQVSMSIAARRATACEPLHWRPAGAARSIEAPVGRTRRGVYDSC